VAIAAAAPALAISGPPPTLAPVSACKLVDNTCVPLVKGFFFEFLVTNPSPLPIWIYTGGSYGPTITDTSPTVDISYAMAQVGTTIYPPGTHIPIPANSTIRLLLNAGDNPGSVDDPSFSITATLQWGHTANPAQDTDHLATPAVGVLNTANTPHCSDCNV